MRPQDDHHHNPRWHQQLSAAPSDMDWLERIDRAVAKARCDLLAAGESVLSWKVSQAVFLALQVQSWSFLGCRMQQVPSLQSLMAVEGKINSFIYCFVETRRITSLYDLERAICKNEGIEQFEELELGPFLQYPLVMHYFSPNSNVTEVFQITSEEIVCHLGEFLSKRKSRKYIEIGDLLSFIAKKKSVSEVDKLGVRIRNLGLHISFILDANRLDANRSEATCWRKSLKEDSIGKDLNFLSSRSDDEDSNDFLNEYKKHDDDCNQHKKSGQNMLADASVSSRIIESENLTYAEWLKRDMEERDKILMDRDNYTKKGRKMKGARLVLETSTMRIFMKKWQEACRACSLPVVIEEMLNMYAPNQKRRHKMGTMLRAYPLVGLLNVAVS